MTEEARESVRGHPGRQARQRFMLGKYEIIAQPIAGSAHMLRYTVFVGGRRIGATASMPTESDCRYLERPPVVPPLKPFQVFYRPGRPKKGAHPPQPLRVQAAARCSLIRIGRGVLPPVFSSVHVLQHERAVTQQRLDPS